jgi:hypothetical protein
MEIDAKWERKNMFESRFQHVPTDVYHCPTPMN